MDFITIAEAARVLGVSEPTVRRMIDRGELRARPLGPRLVRLVRADVENLGQPIREGRA